MIVYDTRRYLGYGVLYYLNMPHLWQQLPFGLMSALISVVISVTVKGSGRLPPRGETQTTLDEGLEALYLLVRSSLTEGDAAQGQGGGRGREG